MQRPYLTIEELAAELELPITAARALTDKGELPALEPSPGSLLVPRLALDAYRRRIAGEVPPRPAIEIVSKSPEESRAEFEAKTGMSPVEWQARWAADEIEDSAENMVLTMDAYGLLSREERQLPE